MVLILAIVRDEDYVVCTLAREYGLFDMRSVRPSIAGTLLVGASKPTLDQVLTAYCADRLSNLVWMLSSGESDRPDSLLDILMGKEKTYELAGFDTPEEFWEALNG